MTFTISSFEKHVFDRWKEGLPKLSGRSTYYLKFIIGPIGNNAIAGRVEDEIEIDITDYSKW